MAISFPNRCCGLLLLFLLPTAALHAAEDAEPSPSAAQPELPEIADEPKTIDPATLMPAKLAVEATVDFSDSSLRELLDWLQAEQDVTVLLEENALSDIDVLPGDPILDHLNGAPIYLLLNRLRSLDLAWYFADDILHVTTLQVAENRLRTIPYNIGDLLDAGHERENLQTVIENAVSPLDWETVGGVGALSFLGDVMFVRQTDPLQREIQGLLAALRKHARQTFVFDPAEHLALRQGLDGNVSVALLDTPLETAVGQLAKDAQIDIRLDRAALGEIRIREREPVTLALKDRKLRTVLQAMLADLGLTWILRDGVLWITSSERAEEFRKTAVYDVRDLCRDEAESEALGNALMSQADPTAWFESGGSCTLQFARPGTLVIHGEESLLSLVFDLLKTYRTALRNSRPREQDTVDPQEVVTIYYRLHANVADGLSTLLPKLVQPESWRTEARPEAEGELIRTASPPDLFDERGRLARTSKADDPDKAHALVVARDVLIIRQTRAAHDEIAEIIRRVGTGDVVDETVMGGMGMGGGMGGGMGSAGFGSGFFSIPPATVNHRDEE